MGAAAGRRGTELGVKGAERLPPLVPPLSFQPEVILEGAAEKLAASRKDTARVLSKGSRRLEELAKKRGTKRKARHQETLEAMTEMRSSLSSFNRDAMTFLMSLPSSLPAEETRAIKALDQGRQRIDQYVRNLSPAVRMAQQNLLKLRKQLEEADDLLRKDIADRARLKEMELRQASLLLATANRLAKGVNDFRHGFAAVEPLRVTICDELARRHEQMRASQDALSRLISLETDLWVILGTETGDKSAGPPDLDTALGAARELGATIGKCASDNIDAVEQILAGLKEAYVCLKLFATDRDRAEKQVKVLKRNWAVAEGADTKKGGTK